MLRWIRARQPRCRRLGSRDGPALDRCLGRDPVGTVFLRSEVRLGALRNGHLLGVIDPLDDEIRAVALCGAMVVPWNPGLHDIPQLAAGLRPQAPGIQLLVGPRDAAAALHEALQDVLPTPRLVRADQPVYTADGATLQLPRAARPPVRRADLADLDRLTTAGAAMHREEVGFDPMDVDPWGFRLRMRTLVDRGWAYVWTEGDELVFKAECAAVTPEAVQLQGVWTDPSRRGRGHGTAAIATLASDLLRDSARVTLFVNDFNTRAIGVYERAGFRRGGTMRSYLY
ncbi:MAG TPA: GNAT family N-acetyltransferase [Candidatus Dormibacteraeota bacterium]|nr:GNAT family N-acetyltransferase [Candidatus Dormibacteraeota bacterium]